MEEFKKYLDNQNYVTKIVGNTDDGAEAPDTGSIVSTLVALLTEESNKDFKEEALLILKKEKAGNLLIDAVKREKKHRAVLVAACWESEIDFSNELDFFITLALDDDYLVSLEAITVVATMAGPFEKTVVEACINKVKEEQKKINSERVVLLNDLRDTLEGFLK